MPCIRHCFLAKNIHLANRANLCPRDSVDKYLCMTLHKYVSRDMQQHFDWSIESLWNLEGAQLRITVR